MKQLFLIMCFFIGLLVIPISMAFAGTGDVPEIGGVESYFTSLAALAGAVILISQFAKKILASSGGWTKFLSWIVSLLLSLVGWWLGLGVFENLTILWVLIYAVAAGLVANSIFDIKVVKGVLNAITNKKPS